MDAAQIIKALAPIPAAINAFTRLLADLEEAGLPLGSLRTRLVEGALRDVEYLGRDHQLMCELETGTELWHKNPKPPRASFKLVHCKESKGPSVSGTYDLEKRHWAAHINAPQGATPAWLKPFMAIVEGTDGKGVEGKTLAYAQLIHAMVPLLAWSSFERRTSAPEAERSVRP